MNQTTGGGNWVLLGRWQFVAGRSGYVQLGNATADVGSTISADAVRFVRASGGTAPSISTQPVSRSVCAGATATFGVAVAGSTPLTYQWRKGATVIANGGHYSGATAAVLTVTGCDLSDAATNYNCFVNNVYGSAYSSNASLSVADPLAVPASLSPSGVTISIVTWNWGSVAGATSYKLWTAASGGTQIGGTITSTLTQRAGCADPARSHITAPDRQRRPKISYRAVRG